MISGENYSEIRKDGSQVKRTTTIDDLRFRGSCTMFIARRAACYCRIIPVSPLLTPLLGRRQRSYVVVATTMIGVCSKSNFEILLLFLYFFFFFFFFCLVLAFIVSFPRNFCYKVLKKFSLAFSSPVFSK